MSTSESGNSAAPPAAAAAAGPSSAGQAAEGEEQSGPRTFKFPSHQSHMVTLAKMCKEKSDYTDCVIQCTGGVEDGDGDHDDDEDHDGDEDHEENRLRAHRLVLGAVSPFMKLVFSEVPASLPEATILVPGVKKRVVKALLDFLYTGEMKVEREDTAELQLLIETLQIDPALISVECLDGGDDDDSSSEEEEDAEVNESESEVKGVVGKADDKGEVKGADDSSQEDKDHGDHTKAKKRKADDGGDEGPSQAAADDKGQPAESSSSSSNKVPKVATNTD